MTCDVVLVTSAKHRPLPSDARDSPELHTAISNHYWLHSKNPIQVSNCVNIHQKLDRDIAWDQDHGSATYCETCWAEMTSWLAHSQLYSALNFQLFPPSVPNPPCLVMKKLYSALVFNKHLYHRHLLGWALREILVVMKMLNLKEEIAKWNICFLTSRTHCIETQATYAMLLTT